MVNSILAMMQRLGYLAFKMAQGTVKASIMEANLNIGKMKKGS
jgi:hypothetical protein